MSGGPERANGQQAAASESRFSFDQQGLQASIALTAPEELANGGIPFFSIDGDFYLDLSVDASGGTGSIRADVRQFQELKIVIIGKFGGDLLIRRVPRVIHQLRHCQIP